MEQHDKEIIRHILDAANDMVRGRVDEAKESLEHAMNEINLNYYC